MKTVANILVVAAEAIYRDKTRHVIRVHKGTSCSFRIYTTTKMGEIMSKVATDLWKIPLDSIRFSFVGESVDPNHDFTSLHMSELDVIDVFHSISYFDLPPSTLKEDLRTMIGVRDGTNFILKVGRPHSSSSPSSFILTKELKNLSRSDESSDFKTISLIEETFSTSGNDLNPNRTTYQEFFVHTAILSSRSPKFYALFHSKMIESMNGYLELPDLQPQTIALLIEFIYTDEIQNGIVPDQLIPLFRLSDEYLLPRLRIKCELELIKNINLANVLEYYSIAHLYSADRLKVACNQFFMDHLSELRKLPNFKEKVDKNQLLEVVEENQRALKKQRTRK